MLLAPRPLTRPIARQVARLAKRPLTRLAAVALAVAAAPVSAALAAGVVDQVPNDAMMFVKFSHLQQTSDKFGVFAKQVGIDRARPEAATPLASLKEQAGIKDGLDDAGDAAVIVYGSATGAATTGPAAEPAADGDKAADLEKTPPVVLLLPVTDYKAFLGNFPEAKMDGDVATVEIGDSTEPTYVVQHGDYAALSQIKALALKKATEPIKPSGKAAAELDKKDIVLYANMPQLRNTLLPKLNEDRQKTIDELVDNATRSIAQRDPQKAQQLKPLFEAGAGQLLNVAEAFLRDADAATVTLTVTENGLMPTVMADFQPDSYLGGMVAKFKGTTDALVKGLPGGEYLLFGGTNLPPDAMKQLVSDVAGPVVDKVKGDENLKSVGDLVKAVENYAGGVKSNSFGFLAPDGALGQVAILQMVTVERGDTAAIMKFKQEGIEAQQAFLGAFGADAGQPKVEHKADAETIDGTSFDSLTVVPDANGPNAPQQQQVMAFVYGPSGARTLYGKVGDSVLSFSGLDEGQMKTAIDAAKADKDNLTTAAGMDEVTGALPKGKIAVVYIPLDRLLTSATKVGGAFMQFNVAVPANLPPIGEALSTDGSTLMLDGYVPTKLIQALVTAGIQARQQMQGGGGGM